MAGKTQQGVKQLKPESGIFKFEKNMVNPTECMCDSDSWFLTYFDYSNQEDSSFDAYPQFALIQDSNNERKYTMPRIRLNDVNRCIKIKIASDFSKKSKFDNIGRVGLLQFPLPEDSEEIPLSDFLGKDYDERDLHICPFLRHNQLRTDLVRIVKIDRKNSNFNINEEQQSVVLKEPIEPLTELVMTQTIEQGGHRILWSI